VLKLFPLDSAIISFCFLFLFSLVRLNGKKIRELYFHANSNVISMNSLNIVIANAMEKSKLGEASFYDIFSSSALEEKIFSDDTLSPICDN
jgi:hypothetical protein